MEDVSFDVDKLKEMKRPQLQKLCKKHGIKANSKTSQLISDLKELAKTSTVSQHKTKTKCKTPEPKTPENVITNKPTIPLDYEMKDQPTDKDAEKSYKEQIMKQLEIKVQETLKESKIPILAGRNVTFTVGTESAKRRSLSKNKEHQAFKKMDSIDVYLAKKRKRTQSMYANIKKAKGVANNARTIIADMKASHNTPANMSPKKKRRSTYSIKKEDVKIPSSFSFGHLKSPKVTKPGFVTEKPKTHASRKTMFAINNTKENRTAFESRKSMAVTPFRCNKGPLDTTSNSSLPAKKKFDLQSSLSKPLSYKPHTGKIMKFPYLSQESKIPVRVAKKPLVDHKKDVKSVKVTSRADRRQINRNNRANKRESAMLARRGLAN